MEKRKRCCCGENGKEKSNGIGKRLAKMKGLGFIDSDDEAWQSGFPAGHKFRKKKKKDSES